MKKSTWLWLRSLTKKDMDRPIAGNQLSEILKQARRDAKTRGQDTHITDQNVAIKEGHFELVRLQEENAKMSEQIIENDKRMSKIERDGAKEKEVVRYILDQEQK